MYSDEFRNVIYRLNQQYKKSSERLKKDFNIEGNIELKKPSKINSKRELMSYVKKVSAFNTKARQYRSYTTGYKITPTKIVTPRGVEISKKKVNKLRKELNRVNQNKLRRARKYNLNQPLKKAGKNTDMTIKEFAGLGRTKYDEFKPKKLNLNAIQTERDYKNMLKRLENTYTREFYKKRDKNFIMNYKRSLINTFGNAETYKIRRAINKLSVDEFMKIYYSDVDVSFSYMYSFIDAQLKLKTLEELFM